MERHWFNMSFKSLSTLICLLITIQHSENTMRTGTSNSLMIRDEIICIPRFPMLLSSRHFLVSWSEGTNSSLYSSISPAQFSCLQNAFCQMQTLLKWLIKWGRKGELASQCSCLANKSVHINSIHLFNNIIHNIPSPHALPHALRLEFTVS